MNNPASEQCDICGERMEFFTTHRLLRRYDVAYFICPACTFVRSEQPYWLEEAYSHAIAATDTGIVRRNLKIARQLAFLLPALVGERGKFLDVAGGSGLLTRLMRDAGFDFYWEDLYCVNLLAAGFEAERNAGGFDVVTAFEALEHMERPYEFMERCVRRSGSGTLIFTTELFTAPAPDKDWWYFSTATGQHIAFFSERTLQRAAQRLSANFHSYNGLHMLTRLPVTTAVYRKALQRGTRGQAVKRRGFTDTDCRLITQRLIGADPTPQDAAEIDAIVVRNSQNWLARMAQHWKTSLSKQLRALRHPLRKQGER